MAYCNKCGAYIPDGQSKCLACGYDEAAETAAAQATARSAAQQTRNEETYHFRNDDEIYRAQLEEHRRRQQEQSRKWAEEEQRRRAASAQQTRASDNVGGESAAGTDFSRAAAPYSASADRSKLWSVLSYMSVLCLVPLLTGRGGDKARFHAKQGVRLVVFGALADVLSAMPVFGWLFSVARIILMVIGISNAANDRQQPLPYIGNIGSF